MGKFNSLLNLRLKTKTTEKQKMRDLAERSKEGQLSSFSGVFRVSTLNDQEKKALSKILESHKENNDSNINSDLDQLCLITSEVKAITNQAIILHGERIKKAQLLFKKYKEGAFTSWLFETYGNRQTPYNFLQYYEFYSSLPKELRLRIDKMPRQAIYTLASRDGNDETKKEIIKNYSGEPKNELLSVIRKLFPLEKKDKRAPNIAKNVITLLLKVQDLIDDPLFSPTEKQKGLINKLLSNARLKTKN
jgi:hypothetical protein